MGIARAIVKLLIREGKREEFSGNILTIGKQDVFATTRDLRKWAGEMDFELKGAVAMPEKGFIADRALFPSLGFDSIASMDCSDYEHCTIVHDLNKDVPGELHNRYDVVLDSGTSEHIFNFPKVLENYHKMLKVGGRMIHGLPSSNHVDHGFYMFSPTIFYDYYSANNWKIVEPLFFRYYRQHTTKLWKIYHYTPGCLDSYSFGGLRGMYGIFFIVKKTRESTFNAPVQQNSYIRTWSEDNRPGPGGTTKKSGLRTVATHLPEGLKDALRPLYHRLAARRTPRFRLKPIARY
jgi:SAM-dependent methyltransferase